MPNKGDGYYLYDVFQKAPIGRILFDADDHWIYDGDVLTVDEQEAIAGFITGHHQEMNKIDRFIHNIQLYQSGNSKRVGILYIAKRR